MAVHFNVLDIPSSLKPFVQARTNVWQDEVEVYIMGRSKKLHTVLKFPTYPRPLMVNQIWAQVMAEHIRLSQAEIATEALLR